MPSSLDNWAKVFREPDERSFSQTTTSKDLAITLIRYSRIANMSSDGRTGRLGRSDALQELEFVPPRVEARDFVACRFQLRLQLENLRARFRIKIRRGKCGLQFRHLTFRRENSRLHRLPFTLFFPLEFARFFFAFPGLGDGCGRRGF